MGIEVVFSFIGIIFIVYGVFGVVNKKITKHESECEFDYWHGTVTGSEAVSRGLIMIFFGVMLLCLSIWYDEFLDGFGISEQRLHQEFRKDFCDKSRAKGKKCIFEK